MGNTDIYFLVKTGVDSWKFSKHLTVHLQVWLSTTWRKMRHVRCPPRTEKEQARIDWSAAPWMLRLSRWHQLISERQMSRPRTQRPRDVRLCRAGPSTEQTAGRRQAVGRGGASGPLLPPRPRPPRTSPARITYNVILSYGIRYAWQPPLGVGSPRA